MRAEKGEMEIWECDEGMYFAGLRAAAQFLPFLPWRGGIGTSYPEVNRDIKVLEDPVRGEPLLAIPAIKPDIVFVHAAFADTYGNVQHVGTGFGDRALYRAADRTIVQVEKVVSNEAIKRHPSRTSIPYADAIVRANYGSHPYASPGFYIEDVEHIKEYLAAANSYVREKNQAPFESYLKRFVLEPENHADYLERVGIKKLLSLYEF
jgi:glutaconate CoA-transferase subunit A